MKKKCTCKICGRKFYVDECIKVDDPAHHYIYYCHDCYNKEGSYFHEQTKYKKQVSKVLPITIGFELELPKNWTQAKINLTRILHSYGYEPTSDCTAGIEWKSPIYKNLNGLAKNLKQVMEKQGLKIKRTDGVGTHINVWCEGMDSRDYKRIRSYYDELFGPLYKVVSEDTQEKHVALFGRSIFDTDRQGNSWASGFGNNVHAAFINTESCKIDHPRIEFRLAMYANSSQYINCLKFATDCMKTIINNFSKNYITDSQAYEMGKDASYASENNKHKAKIAGNKLVKVYNRYLEKAMEL